MRASKEQLGSPAFRKLRDNLRAIYGTQPTFVGSLLSIMAVIGDLFFTIAIVVVLLVDTKYTVMQMVIGLLVSLLLHWLAKAYDKRFAEINHPKM